MRGISEEPWWIPKSFVGTEAELNSVVICCGPKHKPRLVADFRTTTTSRIEQAANCRLAVRAPDMARALLSLEDSIGDLPSGEATAQMYSIIAEQLRTLQIERPDG
jgi:hypothetical protein